MSDTQIRTYQIENVVRFRRTTEEFGGLSNMAPGFPMVVLGHHIRTSEALYQACRFPHMPEVQAMILSQSSPMTAKMRSKPYRTDSRPDWDDVRVRVMRWCLRVKLAHNWHAFSELLLSTGQRPIVEDSRKDGYWGAIPKDDNTLNGQNVLGRLLMELRNSIEKNPDNLRCVKPLKIHNFNLLGEEIPEISPQRSLSYTAEKNKMEPMQRSFF